MNIWETHIYIKLFHIIYHSFSDDKEYNYLFVGNVEKNVESILLKLDNSYQNFKKLSQQEQNTLIDLYGKNIENELKNKLKEDTELVFQYIHFDDNIDTIQKKILIHLSDNKKDLIFYPEDQYLYVKNKIDNRFYFNIIPYLFLDSKILKTSEIEEELSHILNVKLNLKKKYYQDELTKELIELFNSNSVYDLPISLNFIDKSSDKIIIEYADLFKNKDYDNIKNDRVESNIYSLINNYDCQETIHLFYRNDIIDYSNSNINNIDNTNNSDYLLERYFSKETNKNNNFNNLKKEYSDLFQNIDKKYQNIYNHLSLKLDVDIEKKS